MVAFYSYVYSFLAVVCLVLSAFYFARRSYAQAIVLFVFWCAMGTAMQFNWWMMAGLSVALWLYAMSLRAKAAPFTGTSSRKP